MENIYLKLVRVFSFIFIGYFLGKSDFYSEKWSKYFHNLCFNLLLPLIVVPNIWFLELNQFNNFLLLGCFFISGVIIFFISFFIGRHLFKLKSQQRSIYAFSSCYGNLVGLGIPLAFSVLGEQEIKPFVYLSVFHGFLHIPYATFLTEVLSRKEKKKIKIIFNSIIGLFKNSLFVSLILGLFLNILKIPFPESIEGNYESFSVIFFPSMLILIGTSISSFSINKYYGELVVLIILKNILHPIFGYTLAKYIFSFDNSYILIVTLAAALPSGIQTYYFSARYDVLKHLSSANILVSTFISIFTISMVVYLLS